MLNEGVSVGNADRGNHHADAFSEEATCAMRFSVVAAFSQIVIRSPQRAATSQVRCIRPRVAGTQRDQISSYSVVSEYCDT